MRYAIIINGVVHNLIAWDGAAPWEPPAGSLLVHLGDSEWCDIGCLYDEGANPRFYPAPAGD